MAERSQGTAAVTASTSRLERLARLREDLKASAVVALAFITLGLFVEPTRFGQWLQRLTYYELHERFPGHCEEVVIADITDVPLRSRSPDRDAVTHRVTLIAVLEAILAQKPRAVALDIDLSPGVDGWMDEDDPNLLALCKLEGVLVGVERQCDAPSDEWLRDADHASLATSVKADRVDNRLMPSSYGKRLDRAELPALGRKLASTFLGRVSEGAEVELPRNLFYSAVVHAHHDGMRDEFLVDFSSIERLAAERIQAGSAAEVERIARGASPLRDRAVIIGRADPNRMMENCFVPPGRSTAYPGVYSHACAANTLIQGPLVQPTPLGRVLLDALFAALMFGLVFGVRRLALDSQSDLRLRRAHALASLLASVAVVTAAILLARHGRFVWDGYPFVVAALLLHPLGERIAHALPDAAQRFMFESGPVRGSPVKWGRLAGALLIVIGVRTAWCMLVHEAPPANETVEAASPAASVVQGVEPLQLRWSESTSDEGNFKVSGPITSSLRAFEGERGRTIASLPFKIRPPSQGFDLFTFDGTLPPHLVVASADVVDSRESRPEWARCALLESLAGEERSLGEFRQARERYYEALDLRRAVLRTGQNECDSLRALSTTLRQLGRLLVDLGELVEAHASFTESLALERRLQRECASASGFTAALDGLADVEEQLGDLDCALERRLEAVSRYRDLARTMPGFSFALDGLSTALLRAGKLQQRCGDEGNALRYLSESVDLRRRILDEQGDLTSLRGLSNDLAAYSEVLTSLGRKEESAAAALEAQFLADQLATQEALEFGFGLNIGQ